MSKFDLDMDVFGELKVDGGDIALATSAVGAVRFQLMSEINKWVGDPTAGAPLLTGGNITAERADRLKDETLKAMKKLEARGIIASSSVQIVRESPGRIFVTASCVDLLSSEHITVDVKGGN